MEITFIDETVGLPQNYLADIEKLLNFASNFLKLEQPSELAVVFMNNQQIQEINKSYRGKNAPTDVISFAMEESLENELQVIFSDHDETLPRNLGDIMISTERAQEQALEYAHSFERELGFLALHGFLHLLGYDHMNQEEEQEMFGLQKEILDAYGLKRE